MRASPVTKLMKIIMFWADDADSKRKLRKGLRSYGIWYTLDVWVCVCSGVLGETQ